MTESNGAATRLRWYLDRLRSMPLAEIPHRILEAGKKRLDRRGGFAQRHGRAPASVYQLPPPAFPLNAAALESVTSAERERIAAQAQEIRSGHLRLLGKTWPMGARTDWSLDPVSRQHWDWERFCFDIDRRHGFGAGDVKLTWELSRLQHLQVLALDAYLNDTVESRICCINDLSSWIAENPPYEGLGYACGIELASRVISVLVIAALLGAESLPADLNQGIWDLMQAHGAWLERYPSLYSSANNHFMAEVVGLFVIGCLAPQLPDAARWRNFGQTHIEQEAELQIYADGVGAEQSPAYQAYTLEWLLVARCVGLASKQPLAVIVEQRLQAGAGFLAAILDNAGNHPRYGDDDDACVLRHDMEPEAMPLVIAGTIGALFGHAQMIHPHYRLDLRARLLGASTMPFSAWRPRSQTFSEGGYTVLRDGLNMVMMDHGPLGYAYTAGHGHADALAIWWHMDELPVLVDGGTFRYNQDDGWRTYLRSSAAHNTVVVDGVSQSEQTGPFNWGRRAQGTLVGSDIKGSAEVSISACHDGYQTMGITHLRRVSLENGNLRIRDRVEGKGRHHICIHYQFAPDLNIVADLDQHWQVTRQGGDVAEIRLSGDLAGRVELQSGSLKPGPGAISPHYNELTPAPMLIFENDVELPFEVETVMITAKPGVN